MAFPATPIDGQIHTSTTGLKYVYTAATNSWKMSSGATLGKSNLVATIAPTANDDNTAGYGVGSLWIDTITQSYYNCIDATNATAIWIKTGFKPAYAISSLPLLTVVPAISTAITWPTPTLVDLTQLTGVFTVTTAGVYEISYVANHEATNKRFGYFVSLTVNAVIDPIQGATFTDRNGASTRWPRIVTFNKVLVLTAGTTFSLNHFTDDIASTVSGNMSIKRID